MSDADELTTPAKIHNYPGASVVRLSLITGYLTSPSLHSSLPVATLYLSRNCFCSLGDEVQFILYSGFPSFDDLAEDLGEGTSSHAISKTCLPISEDSFTPLRVAV